SFDYLRVQRCDNGGEKLVRHRGPLRAVYLVLEHRLRSALLDSHQRIILRSKPAHVSRFCCAVQAPDQAGVRRHVSRMKRLSRTKRDEIAGVRVSLPTVVSKIDVHFRDENVFLLRARREEKLLVDAYSLRCLAIELDAPISATAKRK